jgi:hypothetical protein
MRVYTYHDRWVSFRESAAGVGIMVLPAVTVIDSEANSIKIDATRWGWNASRYSTEMLHQSKHEHELIPDRDKIHIHFDRFMMGIGGYDSWTPNVQPEFVIDEHVPITTKFMLLPVLEQNDLHDLYVSHRMN